MKRKAINLKAVLLTSLGLLVAVPLLVWTILRLEGGAPTVLLSGVDVAIGASQTLTITVQDDKSGLRKLRVGLVKGGREAEIFNRDFASGLLPGGDKVRRATFPIVIAPANLGFSDGEALLRVAAWDRSWRGWWHGNQTYIERKVRIDTRPPAIDVLSRFHNVTRGGCGLAVYSLSETCRESGVMVGETFYQGYSGHFDDPAVMLAFFALDQSLGTGVQLHVRAVDMAGNAARSGFQYHLRKKKFRRDKIAISEGFLQSKMPEFDSEPQVAAQKSLLDKFLVVNRDLRKANYQRLLEIVSRRDEQIHWQGRFLRLNNAANRAGFADRRTYTYKGKEIDRQVHLGVDLASLARSPVPAANAGRAVFTDSLGIYGKTVVIDHGFGLFSMYSHLSRIDVQEGQQVARGDVLGRTGRTGLAGGDHLHFSMLVHGTFVNPVEWWDPAWIQNNIQSKLETAALQP